MARAEAPKLEQMAQKDMTGAGGAAAGAGTTAAATPAGGAPGPHAWLEAPRPLQSLLAVPLLLCMLPPYSRPRPLQRCALCEVLFMLYRVQGVC